MSREVQDDSDPCPRKMAAQWREASTQALADLSEMRLRVLRQDAVMQQALEALERADKISGYGNNRKAITALRAALDAPAAVAVGAATNPKSDAIGSASGAYLHAAPQGEPGAWLWLRNGRPVNAFLHEPKYAGDAYWVESGYSAEPLYLAPPEPPHHAACSTTRGGDCDCWYIQPAGWRLVPVEPTKAHLNSIAMRHHHGFGLLPPEQQENVRAFARQMYEECIGRGFYKIDAAPSVTYGSISERAAEGKDAGMWEAAAPQGEPVKGAVWHEGSVSLLSVGHEDAYCARRGAQRLYLHPPAAPQGEAVAWALKFPDDSRICLSTVFDTEEEAQEYADRASPGTTVHALFLTPSPAPSVEWDRFHHVMRKHGLHPGRTDDDLIDLLDKAQHNAAIDALSAALAAPQGGPVADLRDAKWLDPECADAGACQSLRFKPAAPSAPKGWKLVPVEPTEEMLAAAHEGDREYTLRCFGDVMTIQQSPHDHWVAMVAAAPEAPSGERGA